MFLIGWGQAAPQLFDFSFQSLCIIKTPTFFTETQENELAVHRDIVFML